MTSTHREWHGRGQDTCRPEGSGENGVRTQNSRRKKCARVRNLLHTRRRVPRVMDGDHEPRFVMRYIVWQCDGVVRGPMSGRAEQGGAGWRTKRIKVGVQGRRGKER